MNSQQIRQQFLDYFKEKQHIIVPSAPVIPHGDKTLMFTNAGMNQFKDMFLGVGNRDYKRVADTQKCIRVSGKHNDLEEVGVDTYHHTFFEMLGNWSFGDYYKKEAVEWAWDLLTNVWKLPKERLYATVFRTDEEAFDIWKNYLPEDRILRFDEKDNFWEMGETGPCGPCSEIHYDGTEDLSGKDLVNAGDPRVIEIWNLVFMQFNRQLDGTLQELKQKHVDTGMGFERIVRVIQGKSSNYDTDVFMPLINELEVISGKKYGKIEKEDIAFRVIADHIRTISFTIADGAIPGNEGRSYVIRRILRRASRYARTLNIKEPILYRLVDVLISQFRDVFPEIEKQANIIKNVIKGEEESFLRTLEQGILKFEELTANLTQGDVISGDDAFLLYDSYGFPLDLTELMAKENGFSVDIQQFESSMQVQKERSRASAKSNFELADDTDYNVSSEFVGYNQFETESKVLYQKDNILILDKTPFYAEKGGQISDIGVISFENFNLNVIDIKQIGNAILHILEDECSIDILNKEVTAKVDFQRRWNIMRNHSATHLMHEALRQVLGEHIQQQGSLVAESYLRFDFNHFQKITKEEIKLIEDLVNAKIFESIDVKTEEISLDKARENEKIRMFFGDKYGSMVRAVEMDSSYSIELCGGTHVKNTAQIGYFKITSESSVSAGVRRIEAVTGKYIEEYFNKLNSDIASQVQQNEDLRVKIKKLEKEITELKKSSASDDVDSILSNTQNINGINVVISKVSIDNLELLRDTGENLRNKLKTNGVGLLASEIDDKVQLVCVVTDDIKNKYQAGKLVGDAAKFLGGGGGGKPHLATAGAKDLTKLDELLDVKFKEIVSNI